MKFLVYSMFPWDHLLLFDHWACLQVYLSSPSLCLTVLDNVDVDIEVRGVLECWSSLSRILCLKIVGSRVTSCFMKTWSLSDNFWGVVFIHGGTVVRLSNCPWQQYRFQTLVTAGFVTRYVWEHLANNSHGTLPVDWSAPPSRRYATKSWVKSYDNLTPFP